MISDQVRRISVMGRWALYGELAHTPRARAAQRRAVVRAIRVGALALIAMAVLDIAILPVLHPSGVFWFVLANGLLAAAGMLTLASPAAYRRRPDVVAFLLALLPGLTARVVAIAVPEASSLMMIYLLLLPAAITVLLPWRTVMQLRWLTVYAAASLAFLIGPSSRSLGPLEPKDQAIAVTLAVAVSLFGHLLVQRSRLRYVAQVERGRVLRRETIRQRAEIGRLYTELLHTARFDPLTRVGNRLLLDEDLRTLASRLARSGTTAWVLAIDVDDFKNVNDRLGHEAGDRVLASVAHALRSQLRASDSIYRYGGDEFIVLVGEASANEVRVLGERLRRNVEACRIEGVGERVTISLGAAPIAAHDIGSTSGGWLRHADAALYRAKATGRNAVALSTGATDARRPKRETRACA